MLVKIRIIFLLTFALSGYGLTYTAFPSLSEMGSDSLSQQNANFSVLENPFGGVDVFQNKPRAFTRPRKKPRVTTPKRPGQCSFGGKLIGDLCYVVKAAPLGFINARGICGNMDGTFYEPYPILQNNKRDYARFKELFPEEFQIIENDANENPKRLWIGYSSNPGQNDFEGQGGLEGVLKKVLTSDPIFNKAREGKDYDGVALTDTGYWAIFHIDTKLPYICEFYAH